MRCMTWPRSKSTASSIRNELVFLLLIGRSWPPTTDSATHRCVAEAKVIEATHEDSDLVASSSVLHHLYSYASVVERSLKRLAPGGVFYSSYDPLAPKNPFFAHLFDSFDTTLAKPLYDPADILPGIGRRFRKLFSRGDPEFRRAIVSAGDLAEFHARTGMDDQQI